MTKVNWLDPNRHCDVAGCAVVNRKPMTLLPSRNTERYWMCPVIREEYASKLSTWCDTINYHNLLQLLIPLFGIKIQDCCRPLNWHLTFIQTCYKHNMNSTTTIFIFAQKLSQINQQNTFANEIFLSKVMKVDIPLQMLGIDT